MPSVLSVLSTTIVVKLLCYVPHQLWLEYMSLKSGNISLIL